MTGKKLTVHPKKAKVKPAYVRMPIPGILYTHVRAEFVRKNCNRGTGDRIHTQRLNSVRTYGLSYWLKIRQKQLNAITPFRIPVPFRGQTPQIPSNLSPIVPKARLQS